MSFMDSSSSSSCNYDVFLSFRGEDTRVSFTCHLYNALYKGKKIKTFIDDEELRRGDEISPALLDAIQGSKISVVIFSKDFASSKWCLNELVQILECKNLRGQIIIPVFYGVSPSDVGHQTGDFGVGLGKLEQQFKEKPEMVRKWRNKLTETSHLAGHESTKFRNDAQLVDKIVEDVLKKLEKISVSTDSSNGLVGLNSRIEQIKPLLCMDLLDTVQIVGIWGMGGIGKTTLATAIFNQFFREFEGRCFLSDVRRNSETVGGLEHLQKRMLSTILSEKLDVAGPNIPQFTKQRVRRMKVLIVLDDVNKVGQLEVLIGGRDEYGPGSRIVVTTRDKRVLEKFRVEEICKVNGLNFNEAFELFCNFAFKENNCPEDLERHSRRVVRYADGNPLVLKVLGSSLFLKSKRHWENVLDDLNQICESDIHDIYDILKISFNELTDKVKSIFLDIACFFAGEDKDFVTSILDDSLSDGLDVLIDKSLITVSYNHLQMHDLLQEIGREIVRQESEEEPGRRSRLWNHKDVHRVLKYDKGTEAIEGIFLNLSKIKDISLGSEAFTKMPNLRLLKFYIPEGSNILDMSTKVQLPDGLDYLPKKLKYLHWHKYPLRTLPSNFKPKNLVELKLPFSKVVQIWDGEKKTFKLNYIDLSYSRYLEKMPDPSETPNLKRINLLKCTNLGCIPSSIQNFNHLSFLCFKGCKSLRSFPSNLHFFCPMDIDFSSCVNLTEFPQISGNVTNLCLGDTAIEEVPSSIECLNNLENLFLDDCTRLKRVSAKICKFKSLDWLSLDGCLNLENIPEMLEKVEQLNYNASERTEIRELPSSIENVEELETLGLEGCSELDNFPDNIAISQSPSSLPDSNEDKAISLVGCRALVSIAASSLSGLSTFGTVVLNDCGLTAIPQEIGCLSSLVRLGLNGNKFESLPASVKQLPRLRELYLCNCNRLQSLPELPLSLKRLEANNCKQLQSLPEIPSCLEELDASALDKLSKHSLEDNGVEDSYLSLPWVTASPSIDFRFINCLKLGEDVNNKNFTDSQVRIQHMAIASLRLFCELEEKGFRFRKKLGGPTIILPGKDIPDWISHQSSGSDITLQLPQQCCQNLIGFAFCTVLESGYYNPHCHDVVSPHDNFYCRFSIEMNILSERKRVHRGRDFTGYYGTKTDHVMLGFRPFGGVGFPDGNHHTTVLFEFSAFSRDKVVRCGLCPVYANPSETKPNTFTLTFVPKLGIRVI